MSILAAAREGHVFQQLNHGGELTDVDSLLARIRTLQMEARRAGQYHIALGAINTAAKLAQLCS